MATTTYSFILPTVGADQNTWGGFLNENWTKTDNLLGGLNGAVVSGIVIGSATIDNAVIGSTTPNTGAFTTISASSTITADDVDVGGALTVGSASSPNLTILQVSDDFVIKQQGTGDLIIEGQNVLLQNEANLTLIGSNDETAELSYQGTTGAGVKLTTSETGVTVDGALAVPTVNSTDVNSTNVTATTYAGLPVAAESLQGIIDLATESEVKDGVDATKALTAANLLRAAVSNTQVASGGDQGSLEIAGVVIKWGEYDIPSGSTQTITFDNAFPNFCSIAITQREATNPQSTVGVVANSRTAASFQVDTNGFSATIYWIAIGG